MRMDMSATGTSPVTSPCGENSTTWKESCGLTASRLATASVASKSVIRSFIGASVSTSP
jgi:hypothetical protein